MARRTVLYASHLLITLLAVGCAEIEPRLEYEGSLEDLQTVEFRESRNVSSSDLYHPALLVEGGVIVAPVTDYDYGVHLIEFGGRRVRSFGDDSFTGYRFRGVQALAASSDGKLFAVGAIVQHFSSNAIIVYDATTGERVEGPIDAPEGVTGDVTAIAFSPGGDSLAVAWGGDIAIYDISTNILRQPIRLAGGAFDDNIELHFSPTDTDRLVTPDGILSIAAGGLIFSFEDIDRYFTSVCYTTDGRYIVAGGGDGFSLLDAESGEELGVIGDIEEDEFSGEFEHQPHPILSIDVTPDGKYAISGAAEGIVTVWDIATGAVVARDTATSSVIRVSSFPDDPTRFLSSTSRFFTIWQINP